MKKPTVCKARRRMLTAAIAVALFVAVGTAAYATGLLDMVIAKLTPEQTVSELTVYAYGDGNISTAKPMGLDKNENPIFDLPNSQRVPVDGETVETLVGNHTAQVDTTVAVANSTVVFDRFLIDENGMGLMTMTVSDPDGIAYRESGYGQIYFDGVENDGLCSLIGHVGSKDGAIVDVKPYLLSASDDKTQLKLAAYLGTMEAYTKGASVYLQFPYYEKGEYHEGTVVCVTPVDYVPTKTFTGEDGKTVSVSSVGICLLGQPSEDVTAVTLRYADGTSYVVEEAEENVMNHVGGFWQGQPSDNGNLCFLFNRLVDTSNVTSVTVKDNGVSYTYLP